MNNEVYCKNCKHHYTSHFCYPSGQKKRNWWGNLVLSEDVQDCMIVNKNCDCSNYQKKSWRFWITDKPVDQVIRKL